MCGVVAFNSVRPLDRGWIEKALAAIAHRGPDSNGVFLSDSLCCGLGHARLSILDLSSAGHQPMIDNSRRYVISYNGEVYNFKALRAELERRHGPIVWRTATDTEVIIEGFAREGFDFLGRLNGIFALAIFDCREQLLHVLRDPVGIKPLFFTEQAGGVYFCSEMKGLLAIPSLGRTLRKDFLAEQLAFMYVPEPNTPFLEFKKVIPGVCFTYRSGRLIESRQLFQELRSFEPTYSEADAVDVLRSAFALAVERQMVADVPVSMYLSGGLDSSAVAYHAIQSGGRVKTAYTISIDKRDLRNDAQSDDLPFARLISEKLGIELRVITAKRDFLSMLPELVPFMEDGFSDPAAINTFLISEAARKDGVKVLLSGQGADEYLGGYRRYQVAKLLSWIPAPIRSLLAMLNHVLPENMSGRKNALNRRLKRLLGLMGKKGFHQIWGMYTWAEPETVRGLLLDAPGTEAESRFMDMLSENRLADTVDALMVIDRHFDLMSLNLCYTDRMSMAAGVEARVPFLDFDLIRVMNAIPASLKVRNGQAKYVFKKAMEPFLPREIIYREKAGFGLPLRAWMKDGNPVLMHYLDPARIERQGLFNSKAVCQLLREQYQSNKDHSYLLFSLLTQQIWLESNQVV